MPVSYLSERGARFFQPAPTYRKTFAAARERVWCVCAITPIIPWARSTVLDALIVQDRLRQCSAPPQDALCYPDAYSGLRRLRKALAAVLERTSMQGITARPEHITVQAGAGAILDNLFWCIGDAGQGVLIPAPYYQQFDKDLAVRCRMALVPFVLDEGQGGIEQQLSKAAAGAADQGAAIKVLLLTNPNNPLGTLYHRDTLVAALRWCMERKVHLVSDEIYALSVWGDGVPRLQSMECIAQQEAGRMPGGDERACQLLHVVFGMSKDFCASGLRVGCLHSRNEALNQAMDSASYYCSVSGHTQHVLTELLEDVCWLDDFLVENARRLRQSYTILASALQNSGIPFVPASAAMFCWIDLREAGVNQQGLSWEDEALLWEELRSRHGVFLTPGKYCHAPEPGFFRMCWAWVPAEALPVAVGRIRAAIDSWKAKPVVSHGEV